MQHDPTYCDRGRLFMESMRSLRLIVGAVSVLAAAQAFAEEYDHKKLKDPKWDNPAQQIKVNGQSSVEGVYDKSTGILNLDVNGQSSLGVSGSAHRVAITELNGQSDITLVGLKIGSGGLFAKDLNGGHLRTHGLYIGT